MQNRTVAHINREINSKPCVGCEHGGNNKCDSFGRNGIGLDRHNKVFRSFRSNTFSYVTPSHRAVTAEMDR